MLSSWWVLYLLNLINVLFSIKIYIILFSRCNRRKPCAVLDTINERKVSDVFLSWRDLFRVFKHFVCGCNHLDGIIHEFRGFEYLLMARLTVNSNVMGGVYLLFLNMMSVPCSIFLMSDIWLFLSPVSSTVIIVSSILGLFTCFSLDCSLLFGFFLHQKLSLLFYCHLRDYRCLWSCLPSRWWRYQSLLDWCLDRSLSKFSCCKIHLLSVLSCWRL